MQANTERRASAIVPDAGTGGMQVQRYGEVGEVYRCPRHFGIECANCGGSGYRSVCNLTECHENGCSFGTCGSTKAQFDIQQRRAERNMKKVKP